MIIDHYIKVYFEAHPIIIVDRHSQKINLFRIPVYIKSHNRNIKKQIIRKKLLRLEKNYVAVDMAVTVAFVVAIVWPWLFL